MKAILLLFGHLSKLQHSPHPHTRGGTFGEFSKSPLWYPRTYTRGILCQNSDMILHPDPARASRSSPAPEGAGAVLAIAPERRGGDEPPSGDG